MSDTINLSKINSKVQLFMNDECISSSVILFFVFYTCLVAPKLPNSVVPIIGSPLFNLIFLLIIVYLMSKNAVVGMVGSIAFFATLIRANNYEINKLSLSQDSLQVAIEEGQSNAQIILPTVKCGGPQLSSEQIEQINRIKKQYEEEQSSQAVDVETILQDEAVQSVSIKQSLSDDTINDRLSSRAFGISDVSINSNIVGNCTHLSNIEGRPINY